MARKRRLNVVCGEMKEIHYDSRLAHIGIDLASDKGTPIIPAALERSYGNKSFN